MELCVIFDQTYPLFCKMHSNPCLCINNYFIFVNIETILAIIVEWKKQLVLITWQWATATFFLELKKEMEWESHF